MKKEKRIFIAVNKYLLDQLLQIIVKPEIYIISDRYEFLCSIFQLLPDSST